MKSTKAKEILEETSLTLKESRADVISKLMQMQGCCRNEDSQKETLFFSCYKDGTFYVNTNYRRRENKTYYIQGEVVEENGKTIIKIYSVHEKTNVVFRFITLAFILLCIIGIILLYFYADILLAKELFASIATFAVVLIIFLYKGKNEVKNKNVDFDIMKQEVINRVEAVKNWDK